MTGSFMCKWFIVMLKACCKLVKCKEVLLVNRPMKANTFVAVVKVQTSTWNLCCNHRCPSRETDDNLCWWLKHAKTGHIWSTASYWITQTVPGTVSFAAECSCIMQDKFTDTFGTWTFKYLLHEPKLWHVDYLLFCRISVGFMTEKSFSGKKFM